MKTNEYDEIIHQIKKKLEQDGKELLSTLDSYDIIDVDELANIIYMKKIEKIIASEGIKFNKVNPKNPEDERIWFRIKSDGYSEGRKKIYAKNEDDAKQKIYKIFSQKTEEERKKKVTFEEVAQEYLENLKGRVRPGTIRRYRNDYKKFIKDTTLARMRFAEIQMSDIDEFARNEVLAKGVSSKCWGNIKIILGAIIARASKSGYTEITKSRLQDIEIHKTDFVNRSRENDVLTRDELTKIVDFYNTQPYDPYMSALMIMIFTGVRIGELVALKYDDINFTEEKVHISRSEVWVGKEDKRAEEGRSVAVLPGIKGGKSERNATFPRMLKMVADELNCHRKDCEYLVTCNGKRISEKALEAYLRRIEKKLGIGELGKSGFPVKKSPHKIRMAVLSNLQQSGIDLKFAQEQAGHNDITTTLRFYNKSIDNDMEKTKLVADKLVRIVDVSIKTKNSTQLDPVEIC